MPGSIWEFGGPPGSAGSDFTAGADLGFGPPGPGFPSGLWIGVPSEPPAPPGFHYPTTDTEVENPDLYPPGVLIPDEPRAPPPGVPPGGIPNDLTPGGPGEPPAVPEFGPGPPILFAPGPPALSIVEAPTPTAAPPGLDRLDMPTTGRAPPKLPIPSGGWSWEVYRERAERAVLDTIKRQGVKIGARVLRGVLGGIVGAIGEILTPSELGSGEVVPQKTLDAERAREIEARKLEDILVRARRLPLPQSTPTPMPAPPSGVTGSGLPRPDLGTPSAPTGTVPTPNAPVSASPAPAPAPAPAPTRARAPVPTWPFQLGPALGPLLTPNRPPRIAQDATTGPTLGPATPPVEFNPPQRIPRVRPDPLTPPAPPGVTDPLTPPLTTINPTPLGSSPPSLRPPRTRQKQCDCSQCSDKKRRRKKQRECRARAPVVWAGGPKRGKPAGSRCISWEKL